MSLAAKTFLLRELQALAVQVTGEEVSLVEGAAGACWSWDWNNRVITVAPEYLEEQSADVCRAVLLHESAHCAVTRLHHLLEPETHRLYQDLLNVLEDLRIESWLCTVFPGCAAWLRAANEMILRRVAALPWGASYQLQFLRALLETAHMGSFPKGPAPCVLEALEQTRKAVREQTACHPASSRGRQAARETLNAQQRMLSVFEREIRPVWERLVGMDESQGRPRITTLDATSGMPGNGPRHRALEQVRSKDAKGKGGGTLARSYLERARALCGLIDPLAEEFLRLLETSARQKPLRNQRHGHRVDMRAAMQAEADPRLGEKVWERRLLHTRFDPLLVLALDCSGSMQGKKFDAAFDATVLFSEVCLRAGLPMALWIFNQEVRQVLAPHGQADSSARRTRIDVLRGQCDGGTEMALALGRIHASPELAQYAHPLVFVVSDGMPRAASEISAWIRRFKACAIPLLGIGIGRETRKMADLFPQSVVVPDVTTMAHTLSKVLRKTVLNALSGSLPRQRAA